MKTTEQTSSGYDALDRGRQCLAAGDTVGALALFRQAAAAGVAGGLIELAFIARLNGATEEAVGLLRRAEELARSGDSQAHLECYLAYQVRESGSESWSGPLRRDTDNGDSSRARVRAGGAVGGGRSPDRETSTLTPIIPNAPVSQQLWDSPAANADSIRTALGLLIARSIPETLRRANVTE